jgi:hypothetical protein
MSKMELGMVLIFTPPFLIALSLFIVIHIEMWRQAINKYKLNNDRFELVCVSITTIFEIMLFTGGYLILTK